MYGILKVSSENEEEYELRRGYHCSLCNYVARNYGNVNRFHVSNDSVFLSLLLASQMPREHHVNDSKCNLWSTVNEPDAIFDYVSAVSLMIGKVKVLDAYYDSQSRLPSILLSLQNRCYTQAQNRLSYFGFDPNMFERQVIEQHGLEQKQGDVSYEKLCVPTSTVVSSIFKHTAALSGMFENQEVLSEIGSDVGALLYLLDSYTDVEEDRANGRFNPLLACEYNKSGNIGALKKVPESMIDFCRERLSRIESNCERLSLRRYGSQIIRTLTVVLRERVERIILSPESPESYPGVISENLSLSASLLASPMLVSQGDFDGCCTLCSCDAFAQEASDAIVKEILNRGVQGGAAVLVGGGASILLSRYLKRQKLRTRAHDQQRAGIPTTPPVTSVTEPDATTTDIPTTGPTTSPEVPVTEPGATTTDIQTTGPTTPQVTSVTEPGDTTTDIPSTGPTTPQVTSVTESGATSVTEVSATSTSQVQTRESRMQRIRELQEEIARLTQGDAGK